MRGCFVFFIRICAGLIFEYDLTLLDFLDDEFQRCQVAALDEGARPFPQLNKSPLNQGGEAEFPADFVDDLIAAKGVDHGGVIPMVMVVKGVEPIPAEHL